MIKKLIVALALILIIPIGVKAHDDITADYKVREIAGYMENYPEYQQIEMTYNYLKETVEYDYTFRKNAYTTYGAVIENSAVCQGISFAFYEILTWLELDVNIMIGVVDGEMHAWNFVILKSSGRGYFVDITFDLVSGRKDYFMVSELRGRFVTFFLY